MSNKELLIQVRKDARAEYDKRQVVIGDYEHFLTKRDVYDFFDKWYPNWTLYRIIGAYSSKTVKTINLIRRNKVSINRILHIEYLCISNTFEICYRKRHYHRHGFIYIDNLCQKKMY